MAKRKYSSQFIEELLTENRFWTFWSADMEKCIHVFWKQKTKFAFILDAMKEKLGEGFGYERSVSCDKIDIEFD